MDRYPTPSEMMRARRPYLFSDSENADAYRLSDSELRQHLDTLTDRNQHKDFENFCRKLSERELCPNLRPQTGPEGGGDGKVDTETYPVELQIAERWFVGNGHDGSKVWGFAFSAKKRWSEKVRSDVEGIASTGRRYDQLVFITSRPARQLDRLRIEQELQAEFGLPVAILDREWLVDRVFTHGHKDLAFEHLGAGAHEPDKVKIGPNDFRRQQELDAIEARLKRLGTGEHDRTQAVSDTFDAACLSRELERPRYETDGRFKRAATHAKKYGLDFQHLRAVYEQAWTAVWWFDDIETLDELYDKVEDLAFAGGHAAHVSKLCNLYQILVSRVVQGLEPAEDLSQQARGERLAGKLEVMAADKSRPNNALYAETLLAFHRMNDRLLKGERKDFDETWLAVSNIIDRAAGLGEFPADLIDSAVSALSENVPDSETFDALVEKLAEFMSARSQEISAGRFYLSQGERKLDKGKRIEGIRWLGRAVVSFAKEECREDQAKTLYYLSCGYRGAGLLWAARAAALASAIQYLALSEIESEIRIETLPTFRLLGLISLQLGHVMDALAAHRFMLSLGEVLPIDDASRERVRDNHIEFDRLLACLIVIQPPREIERIARLPDVLESMGLFTARLMLLYRLGYSDTLRTDGSLPPDMPEEELCDMMERAAAQPATSSFPTTLVIFDGEKDSVRTKILGVNMEVVTDQTLDGFLLAQTYAATLEAFNATMLQMGAFPHAERLTIKVERRGDIDEDGVDLENGNVLKISIPSGWSLTDPTVVAPFSRHLVTTSIIAMTSVAAIRASISKLTEIVEKERVLERATLFSNEANSRRRAFGTYAGQIADWDHTIKDLYPPRIDAPVAPRPSSQLWSGEDNDDEFPTSIEELENHNDLVVRSPINRSLWDAAGWEGIAFGFPPFGNPPTVGLIFKEKRKAEAIFQEWGLRYSGQDTSDDIRISVIRGIDQANPSHYRVHVTHDVKYEQEHHGKAMIVTSRMLTMMPSDTRNLDLFLSLLEASSSYFLTFATAAVSGQPAFAYDLRIAKTSFVTREAWQVGLDDIDAWAIRPEDNPIIPPNQIDPPILAVLAARKFQQNEVLE